MDDLELDDRYIDQHIVAARDGIRDVAGLVDDGRLDAAAALFRATRVQHVQPVADELSDQFVENYAMVGRQLAKRLQQDPTYAAMAPEFWDAVAKAYDRLARTNAMNAVYKAFATDARLQARTVHRPGPELRNHR